MNSLLMLLVGIICLVYLSFTSNEFSDSIKHYLELIFRYIKYKVLFRINYLTEIKYIWSEFFNKIKY